MDKQKVSRVCGWVAIIMAALFVPAVITDWVRYNATLNSAPFYIWIIVDAVTFLLPAAISFAFHLILKPKY